MTPALYRVLSISTRHQSHRLLTHAVPVIAQLWGGPSNPNLYWDGLDSSSREKQLPVLGSYWDSFKRGSRQQDEENSETTESSTLLKNVGNSLDILLTLTTVLRFSLEPLPSKGLESVLQICQSDLGYDMMPDHVASLVQSTFKVTLINTDPLLLRSYITAVVRRYTCLTKLISRPLLVTIGHSDRMDKSTVGPSPLLFHESL